MNLRISDHAAVSGPGLPGVAAPAAAPGGGLPIAALLLADARLPAGGHAHSHGLESAVAAGRVSDLPSLRAFVVGRLWTSGLSTAAMAAATAAACVPRPAEPGAAASKRADRGGKPSPATVSPHVLGDPSALDAAAGAGTTLRHVDWAALDAEAGARLPAPALRAVSQRLGRQLLRVAVATWPSPLLAALRDAVGQGPHQAVVLGAAGAAAGLDPHGTAVCAGYLTVTGATSAALRLLGLDPYAVTALIADLLGDVERVADEATRDLDGPLAALPCPASPLADIAAQDHAAWEVRLFAS